MYQGAVKTIVDYAAIEDPFHVHDDSRDERATTEICVECAIGSVSKPISKSNRTKIRLTFGQHGLSGGMSPVSGGMSPDRSRKVKNKPTLWHQGFADLVMMRAPPDVDVQSEVNFRSIPNRSDLLLVRRGRGDLLVLAIYLRLFSNYPVTERAALSWWRRWQDEATMENIDNVEGSDELFAKLLESLPDRLRLAGMTPEQRLAGLDPEQLQRLQALLERKLGTSK